MVGWAGAAGRDKGKHRALTTDVCPKLVYTKIGAPGGTIALASSWCSHGFGCVLHDAFVSLVLECGDCWSVNYGCIMLGQGPAVPSIRFMTL